MGGEGLGERAEQRQSVNYDLPHETNKLYVDIIIRLIICVSMRYVWWSNRERGEVVARR